MRIVGAVVLALGMACGGGQRAAKPDDEVTGELKNPADEVICCCAHPSRDDASVTEHEMLPESNCADFDGACVEGDACRPAE